MTFLPGWASRRERRIWLTVLGTTLGTLALTGLAIRVGVSRETDLADPVAGVTSEYKRAGAVDAPPIRFVDVAGDMGLTMRHGPGARGRHLPEDTGSGLAWGDYDGDGDPDLYVVNFPSPLGSDPDPTGTNRLFRNDGAGFTDVTGVAGVGDPRGFGMGASFADYDGDGDLDLYVTNLGPNRLYRNRGDGTFEEVASAAGVADPSWSTGAAWGDFDRDGRLDLYVCNYVRYDPGAAGGKTAAETRMGTYAVPFTLNPNAFDPAPNRLYRNRGDGTFEDVAGLAGVADVDGRSFSATMCDLDGDGWLDLYVVNDASSNRLFRNLGGERVVGEPVRFADLSDVTGTSDPRGSMGLVVGEFGAMADAEDGLPDLFFTNWVAQENALYQSVRVAAGVLEYRDRSRQFQLAEVSLDTVGWGCAQADLDLDGRPDLVVANGSTLERKDDRSRLTPEPMFVFWNGGDRFHDVATAAGATTAVPHDARGLAVADFDRDGDIDVAVSVNRGSPLLLRNDTPTDHRALAVRLQGSAAAAFGARIEVTVAGSRQYRWNGADVSFLSQHFPEAIFGLGRAERAERVEVLWADGAVSSFVDVPAGVLEVAPTDRRRSRD